jgi:hypothetical protein
MYGQTWALPAVRQNAWSFDWTIVGIRASPAPENLNILEDIACSVIWRDKESNA